MASLQPIAVSHPQLTADDISCDHTDFVSSKLDFLDVVSSSQCAVEEPAASELPPPNRFRRQGKKGFMSRVDLKVQSQNQDYLVSYRQATGQLLNEAFSTARPMQQAELREIARQIYLRA
jgi:hypothetical protein